MTIGTPIPTPPSNPPTLRPNTLFPRLPQNSPPAPPGLPLPGLTLHPPVITAARQPPQHNLRKKFSLAAPIRGFLQVPQAAPLAMNLPIALATLTAIAFTAPASARPDSTPVTGPWQRSLEEHPIITPSTKSPTTHPPRPSSLQATVRFSWAGIEAATASLSLHADKNGTWRFSLAGGTSGPPARLFPITFHYHATGCLRHWLTDSMTLREITPRRTILATARFSPEGVWHARGRVGLDAEKPPKLLPLPGLRDTAAASFLARHANWETPRTAHTLIFTGDSAWFVSVRSLKHEPIPFQGHQLEAIPLRIVPRRIETRGPARGTLRPHPLLRELRVWLEASPSRRPLRAEAVFWFGSVRAELLQWDETSPTPPPSNTATADLRPLHASPSRE